MGSGKFGAQNTNASLPGSAIRNETISINEIDTTTRTSFYYKIASAEAYPTNYTTARGQTGRVIAGTGLNFLTYYAMFTAQPGRKYRFQSVMNEVLPNYTDVSLGYCTSGGVYINLYMAIYGLTTPNVWAYRTIFWNFVAAYPDAQAGGPFVSGQFHALCDYWWTPDFASAKTTAIALTASCVRPTGGSPPSQALFVYNTSNFQQYGLRVFGSAY